jgi:hypothetical protein
VRAYGDPLDNTPDEWGDFLLRDVRLVCTEDELRRVYAFIGTVLEEQTFEETSWHVHFRHHDLLWTEAEENPDLTIVYEGTT